MRWCVHAPVQLLNYAAACILFPSACRAKLVKGGAGGGAGAGGTLSDPALRSCLLALSAKVGAQPAAVSAWTLRPPAAAVLPLRQDRNTPRHCMGGVPRSVLGAEAGRIWLQQPFSKCPFLTLSPLPPALPRTPVPRRQLQVFLLTVALPLLALRKLEAGARTIFLTHRARQLQLQRAAAVAAPPSGPGASSAGVVE